MASIDFKQIQGQNNRFDDFGAKDLKAFHAIDSVQDHQITQYFVDHANQNIVQVNLVLWFLLLYEKESMTNLLLNHSCQRRFFRDNGEFGQTRRRCTQNSTPDSPSVLPHCVFGIFASSAVQTFDATSLGGSRLVLLTRDNDDDGGDHGGLAR